MIKFARTKSVLHFFEVTSVFKKMLIQRKIDNNWNQLLNVIVLFGAGKLSRLQRVDSDVVNLILFPTWCTVG